jgi:hypothetical protein
MNNQASGAPYFFDNLKLLTGEIVGIPPEPFGIALFLRDSTLTLITMKKLA